jgi:hypothetical protein
MPLHVIGLLNISIGKEEFLVNEYVKIINREYFEKNNISMPNNIRFYKTFIVSTCDFGKDISKAPVEMRAFLPTYLLGAIKINLYELEIENSSWFSGESFETLTEFVKISSISVITPATISASWIDAFKIDKIVHDIDETTILTIISFFNRLAALYTTQDQSIFDINLHWFYAFTKFQECCVHPDTRSAVYNITAALEFLLVNTSNESDYRAALFASLIYSDEVEERMVCYDFMKWAFSIRDRLSSLSLSSGKSFLDKSELPENISLLRKILAKVLLRTLGLSPIVLQEKLNNMIFSCPKLT